MSKYSPIKLGNDTYIQVRNVIKFKKNGSGVTKVWYKNIYSEIVTIDVEVDIDEFARSIDEALAR